MGLIGKYLCVVAVLMAMFFAGMHAENWRHAQHESSHEARAEQQIKSEIIDTLNRQDAAWNSGDIDAFMADYWKSDKLRFASGGTIKRGWQATRDGYFTRYPDRAAMGKLAFTDMEINVVSDTDALVFAKWRLARAADAPGGLFTLHMHKTGGKWLIMSDHTSSE